MWKQIALGIIVGESGVGLISFIAIQIANWWGA